MANPLRWFRRHQKLMMVFFGVGLMVVFGLGTVVSMINPSDLQTTTDDSVVATWKGGDISRNQLDSLQTRHFQTMSFLRNVMRVAAEQKGENFQSLAMPIRSIADGQDVQQDVVDGRLIDKLMLAKLAEEEGLVVSDGMVDDYIALVGGNLPMSKNQLIAINRQANQGQADLEHIYRHLKLELAEQQMNALTIGGMPLAPNITESIELHARNTETIDCQVYGIDVASQAITEEPSSSELKKLYDQGKSYYADSKGIKPGFKVGRKMKLQYLVADMETFLQIEMAKLTDEEVQVEYDRLVAMKDPMVMEIVPIDNPAIDLPGETTPDGDDPAPAPGEGEDPAPAPAEAETTEGATEEGVEQGATEGGLSTTRISPKLSYVSTNFQEEGTTEEIGEAIGGAQGEATENVLEEAIESLPGESTTPVETPMQDEVVGETGEPAQAVAAEQAVTESTQESTQDPIPGSLEAMEQTEPGQPELPTMEDEKEPEMRPKPLKDVADAIKRSMKQEAAFAASKKAIMNAEHGIGLYRSTYSRWKFSPDRDDADEPAPFDGKKVADENNLVFAETGLIDFPALMEDDLGKIFVITPQRSMEPLGRMIFSSYNDIEFFDASTETDLMTRKTYMFWAVEKAEAREPTFEECKEDVIEFWKKGARLAKAKAEAEKIAEQINNLKSETETLQTQYEAKTVQTGGFTWFNTAQGRPSISVPPGVLNPGNDFMASVFALKSRETGVAVNASRDMVYVVQKISADTPLTDVGKDYLDNNFFRFKRTSPDVRQISEWYVRDLNQDWGTRFGESMDLKLHGQ